MTKKYELVQEFNYYAKPSDCDVIIRYTASLFKEGELLKFIAEDDSKDLLEIGKVTLEVVGVAKELLMKLVGPMTEEAGLFLGNEIK